MIRKLMASSAVIALVGAGALTMAQAQTNSASPANPAVINESAANVAQPSPDAASNKVLTPDQPTLASVFIGRSVYSGEGDDAENIGDVNDLIVAENGAITDAVVGVGGFLGIGQKEVAVPFDQLKVEQKEGDIRLIYSATREQLEAAPAFDRTAYDPIARYNEQQAAAVDNSAAPGLTPPLAPAAADMTAALATDQTAVTEQPAAGDQDLAANQAPSSDDEAPTAGGNLAATEPTPANDNGPAALADQNMAANETAPAAGQPATDEQNASAATAPTDDQTVTTDLAAQQVAPTGDKAAAGTENVTTLATAPKDQNGVTFMTPDTQQIRASTLIGQSVYGPGDESIGKVSDLVFEEEGNTRAAVIDVGGFLGIGSKAVAIGFKDLSFTQAENGKDMKVSVAVTKDQLDQLPAFEPKAHVAATDQPAGTSAPMTGDQPSDKVAAGTAAVQPAPADQAQAAHQTATNEAATPPAGATQPADEATADATQPTQNEQPVVASTESEADVNNLTTGSIGGASTYELASQDVAASSLIGASVYGPEDASIGNINDVVFDQSGKIDGVIINVGGFLGLGAKPVAVGFDSLNVRADENGTLVVMFDASKGQLENAPTYEEKDAATFQ